MEFSKYLSAIYALLLSFLAVSTMAAIVCTGPDCIIYDISTQSSCTEVSYEPPNRDCRWYAGLQFNADQLVKGGRIAAYKIQWSNGAWTAWYFYSLVTFINITKLLFIFVIKLNMYIPITS